MSEILLENHHNTAVITMNKPSNYNAITSDFTEQLKKILLEVEANPEVHCVILTGVGKGFCSGADLHALKETNLDDFEEGRLFMRQVQEIGPLLLNLRIPVIAAVNGVCVGGGFSLALACDYIISAKSATYSMIFSKVGLVPDLGGMFLLPKLIGLGKTKRLVYTADIIDAEEALDLGIVESVVDDDKLFDVCMDEAATIASRAPRAISYAKNTLNESPDLSFNNLIEKEALQQASLFQTNDFKEAVSAFKEKRDPDFQGN